MWILEEWQIYGMTEEGVGWEIVGKRTGEIGLALHAKLRDFIRKFLHNKSHMNRSELSQPFVVKLEEVYLKIKMFRITGV